MSHFDTILAMALAGEGGGGGGSSDFSTATVTFKALTYPYHITSIPYIDVEHEMCGSLVVEEVGTSEQGTTLIVPLYKGKAFISFRSLVDVSEQVLPTVSGNITMNMESYYFMVEGDGVITADGVSGG